MKEKNGGGYRELEQEIIEKSQIEFVYQKAREDLMNESAVFDQRAYEAIKGTEAAGFSMEKGQYIDLVK